MRSRTATAPSSEKRSCGSATQSGVAMPCSRSIDLALGLSQASRDAARVAAYVRHAAQVEHAAQRAVLTGRAVQGDHDRVGGSSCSVGSRETSASLSSADRPAPRKRVQDSAARAQRHVSFVGQAAGEDQDVRF